MTEPLAPAEPPGLQRVTVTPRPRAVRIAVGLAALGTAETLAVYLAVAHRLPSQVVDHFGIDGSPNGALPPLLFLLVSVLEVLGISAVFIGMQAWVARSVSLAVQFRGRLPGPLLLLQGAIVVGVLPLTNGLLLTSAAGIFPWSGNQLGWLQFVIGVGSAVAILGAAFWQGRQWTPVVPDPGGALPMYRIRGSVGAPVEMRCPSCGDRYLLSGVPLFAPHMGVGQFGSLYLQCPRCGERGWNQIVARHLRRTETTRAAPGGP